MHHFKVNAAAFGLSPIINLVIKIFQLNYSLIYSIRRKYHDLLFKIQNYLEDYL